MNFPSLDVPLDYAGPAGPISIYALVDPRDETVRYVGRSKHCGKRLSAHMSGDASIDGNRRKHLWLKRLKARQQKPIVVELERCELIAYPATERKWIAHYRSKGDIYNVRDGDNDGRRLERRPSVFTSRVAVRLTADELARATAEAVRWKIPMRHLVRWIVAKYSESAKAVRRLPPPLPANSPQVFYFKVPQKTYAEIGAAAAASALTIPQWARAVVRRGLVHLSKKDPTDPTP